MNKGIRFFGGLAVVVLLGSIWSVFSGLDESSLAEPTVGNPSTTIHAYKRWRNAKLQSSYPDTFTIPILDALAHAAKHSQARGEARIDILDASVTINVTGLDQASEYGVWLIDESPNGDRHLELGSFAPGLNSPVTLQLDAKQLHDFELNQLVISKLSDGVLGQTSISGSPNLFQRLYFAERYGFNKENSGRHADSTNPLKSLLPSPAFATSGDPEAAITALIATGEQLFFEETFDGNGRTCGTCHRADNNFTIDPIYIGTLPLSDPLFVAETNPALATLENPSLMRQFGLILTNPDGFDDLTNKFSMRSVSHTLGMAASIQSDATEAPFDRVGWSGDGAPGAGRLRDFATGAVKQHYPLSLGRVVGTDFRLPTESELDALEAFMLSLGRPTDFDISGLVLANSSAEKGRGFFLTTDSAAGPSAAKCQLCHQNGGAFTENGAGKTFNGNFDTGVEAHSNSTDSLQQHAAITAGFTLPVDGGFGVEPDPDTGTFGDGQFNAQSLWEAADTAPFFHNNFAATLEDALSHYASNEFKNSPEGFFLRSRDSAAADVEVEVDDLAAFLRVLNAIENIRSASDYLARAGSASDPVVADERLSLADAEIVDAVEVLAASDVHVEDAVPLLTAARASITNATAAGDPVAFTSAVDGAVGQLASARSLMVVTEPLPIDPPAPAETVLPTPDMNGDGTINFIDLGMLKSVFFSADPSADFNGDGIVNFVDLGIMRSLFFTTTNPPTTGDTIAPSVDIDLPLADTVIGGRTPVAVTAADNIGVTKVVFRSGAIVIGQDEVAPFSMTWLTHSFENGSHTLEATASDEEGNHSVSMISVTVDNPPCTSVYGCSHGTPSPPPDPVTPVPSSLDSLPEFKGLVRSKDMDLSTLTIEEVSADPISGLDIPNGIFKTFIIHSDTAFNSDFAQNLLHVLPDHRVEGKFIFTSAGKEVAKIEVSLGD